YAQIVNGAPFDVFLAADAERPKRLEEDGQAIAGSRFVYAKGTLVLWRPDGDGPEDVLPALNQGDFRFLAIANPRTAPYGTAAEQVLRRLELWDALQSRIVRGENVAQAYGFVKSGHAQLGFVALAQLVGQAERGPGTWWVVPEDHYAPIEQQAVLLRDTEPAWAFARFLQAPSTAATLRSLGYGLPQ
ncbi:MAG: molybdate ABC transporter substrate-binding protein, partial [Xanthomonadales bacterium]|nr:molybdate ABC transporter substrate-binding protein [Xanthomonadales bacterium]